MGNLFGNANTNAQPSSRDALQGKYNAARASLLAVILFTLVNVILVFVDSNTYFLFSLFVPYILVALGALYTGRISGYSIPPVYMWSDTAFYIAIAIAAVCILLFFLCWIFSKKNKAGWLIAALVLSVIDTGLGIWYYGIGTEIIMDLVFHAWVIFSLASGISAHKKLKALPPEEEIVDTTGEVIEAAPEAIEEAPAATEEAAEEIPAEATEEAAEEAAE